MSEFVFVSHVEIGGESEINGEVNIEGRKRRSGNKHGKENLRPIDAG